MHLEWRKRFLQAPVHRCEVVEEEARGELQAFRKRAEAKVAVEGQAELDARIVEEGEDWSVDEVALHCRTTPTIVRKARLKAGVSVETGKVPTTLTLTIDERDRAREMRENGMSERQIRFVLGCGGSKLQRLLAA